MAAGFGAAGHIGFAKEASGGVAVAATNYIEALSENFTVTIDRFDVKNIVGRFAEPDDMAGVKRFEGQIVFPAHPVDMGWFLGGAMGVNAQSTVLSGFLWNNAFTMRTTDFDAEYAQNPFTFEIFRDVTSSQQYAGTNMGTFEMSVAPNQELRCTVGLIGKTQTNITKTTPTFVTSPAAPFAFDTCSVSIAGASTALIEGFTVNINSQLSGIPSLRNSRDIRMIRRTGPQLIRVSGNIAFESITEYTQFLDETEQRFVLNFYRANSFGFTIDLPRVVYTAFPIGIAGRDRVLVGFDGIARYHTGSANAIKCTLTTTRSFF
ncbi:MAG: phage tail tube protein [Acidobacteria bacterium]|nr:phage tail tube protein [Acidobacteriota bacterium]